MLRKVVGIILVLFLLVPLISWAVWYLSPVRAIRILIVDKTSTTLEGREHRSFNWILTYEKFTKPGKGTYAVSADYAGFVPLANGKYTTRGLEWYAESRIDSLSRQYDMTYYVDTYGVERREWFGSDTTEHPGPAMLYGGLQRNDLLFLEAMKKEKKLILAEFNFFASPTTDSMRVAAGQLFGLHWTGWTGRYYESLDTVNNPELPHWVVALYKRNHNYQWPFHHQGLVFVNTSEQVAVLEYPTHLSRSMPSIESSDDAEKRFHIPGSLPYPYWFDITLADTLHTVVSYYILSTNQAGDSVLHAFGIPKIFPAVIEQRDQYRFYYFAGDFADNPIWSTAWAHFRGIVWLRPRLLDEAEAGDRRNFYWRYYYPLVRTIIHEYYADRHLKATDP